MKKILLLCGLLLALSATVASASGINLSWSLCGAAGQESRTFACTSNAGLNPMVGSVYLPVDQPAMAGMEIVIELQSDTPVLPQWWHMRTAGTCRPGATVLVANTANLGSGTCQDAYGGAGAGGIGSYTIGYGGPNRARILAGFAVPAGSEQPLTAETEYGVATVQFNNTKSVGTGSCAGCNVGVCLVATQITSRQPAGQGDITIVHPAERNHVRWQNPTQVTCLGATPTQKSTWGSIKTLYR